MSGQTAPERVANVLIPVNTTEGRVSMVRVSMLEIDARAVMNMSGDRAADYGPFFELVKQAMTDFVIKEG